ncbi:serine/arginine-rich splicing factor 11 [Rhipicephalus sanguineus]|uniref:serine/arginine-rich splicing factor 11 n=1 Tax=Rhipicephalus sanguineus TaxID=34632 RepID=UPI0020C2AAE9|nr:serine/arginine-rich splicing factor 11 [Rhipicephalus sanguineus]
MSSKENKVKKVSQDKKQARTREDGKKRTKSSKRTKSKDSSVSKAAKSGKKKERAAKKRGDKSREGTGEPSEGKPASKKSKPRQEKADSKIDAHSSSRKSKSSRSRRKGGKGSSGKRKSVFRKIYSKLRGSKGKRKKSKRKTSSKSDKASESSKLATTATSTQPGGTTDVEHRHPEELASSSRAPDGKHEDGVPGDPTRKATEQRIPDQKAPETKIPAEKMPGEKSTEAVEFSGPASAQAAKASSKDAGVVNAPEPTGKLQHQKASDTEKEPIEKVGQKAPASAPVAQQVEELATSNGPLPVQKNRTAMSTPVKTAALEAVQSDNRAPSAVEADPIGGRQAPTSKPREAVIQPERLPIKDDGWPDAASSTAFTCPETHTEHTGAISIDWASLQDFLLPEFAAVL